MTTALPSLDILLEILQGEREKQLAHFDALDSKAGIVIGFAGVLIALSGGIDGWWQNLGLLAAVIAAGSALAAFWPRLLPTLVPSTVTDYMTSDPAFTKRRLVDTIEVMLNETTVLLAIKARRLKGSLFALALAAVLYGGGVLTS